MFLRRPTHTAASVIKKMFRPGERSLPRNEIIERLDRYLRESFRDADAETLLANVLAQPASPIRNGRSDAILELTYVPHQVFDLAFRFLRDTHSPRSMEQIIPELRKKTSFSWNQVARLLELQRDPRFVQYEGDTRWFLAEWKLANDLVHQFAREREFQQLAARSSGHILEVYLGLNPKEYVFLPELDNRFQVEGEVIYIQHVEEAQGVADDAAEPAAVVTEGSDQPDVVITEAAAEVAATLIEETVETMESIESIEADEKNQPIEEEFVMNTTMNKPVMQEVDQLLKQAITLLENRNQEMGQEVVANFQQSNMQAIEELMQEKWKNEQIVQGIQQVLTTIGQ